MLWVGSDWSRPAVSLVLSSHPAGEVLSYFLLPTSYLLPPEESDAAACAVDSPAAHTERSERLGGPLVAS